MSARSPGELLRLWRDCGAAAIWLPELAADAPDVDRGERDPVLLTVLLTSSPAAVLRRLKASSAEVARAQGASAVPAEPDGRDERAVRRWLSAAGASADDAMTLHRWRTGEKPWWRPAAKWYIRM